MRVKTMNYISTVKQSSKVFLVLINNYVEKLISCKLYDLLSALTVYCLQTISAVELRWFVVK